MASTQRRFVARSRGQVMVLGAVSLLVMALMLMASFSVSNAIHEKIRIQAHADAEAYSVAVLEARAFNATTHYNRAIAAALVAQMSLHSWMAIATSNVAQLEGETIALLMVAALEIVECIPYQWIHCVHAFIAMANSAKVYSTFKDWVDKLKNHEQAFNDGVKALKEMADALHTSQKDVLGRMWNQFSTDSEILKSIRKTNASSSEYAGTLPALNRQDFACALEGSQFDSPSDKECAGHFKRNKSTAEARSQIMENVANADRPAFDQNSMPALASGVNPENWDWGNGKVPSDALWRGDWDLLVENTSASVTKEFRGGEQNDEGPKVGAAGIGLVMVSDYFDQSGFGPIVADVYSDSSGGRHKTLIMTIDNDHSEFKGEVSGDPCGESNCFVNYRADTSADHDFGEPTVYGGVTQNLRLYHLKNNGRFGEHAPWELNDKGEVKVELVRGDPATINYVARNQGQGFAVAKAKVYFHQLGNWASPPNFFDPFWRAKLHFFGRQEMSDILGNVGDSDGQALVKAGAPVEGEGP